MADLTAIAIELERHVGAGGWDQPARLYALVDTDELLDTQPHLAATIEPEPGGLTPVEQEPLDGDLADLLTRIVWPEQVRGCGLVNEVWMLPSDEPPTGMDPETWATEHPDRREVRLSTVVLRDGTHAGCLRVRGRDGAEDDVVVAPDLVPNLTAALMDTLAPDE